MADGGSRGGRISSEGHERGLCGKENAVPRALTYNESWKEGPGTLFTTTKLTSARRRGR